MRHTKTHTRTHTHRHAHTHHRSDDAALRVAEQTDARAVDHVAVLRAQIANGARDVAGELRRSRRVDAPGRATDASIVATQHGNAASCQIVGQQQERFVAEDFLVAILRPRARDENDGRCWLLSLCRQRQRASNPHLIDVVLERDFNLCVFETKQLTNAAS
jgi:hypothetical protein